MAWWNFWRSRRERDLDDELSHDFAATVDERIRAGLAPHEAECAARREFGNVSAIREHVRDAWGWGRSERFWQDIRYGLRSMRRTPGLTIVIVLTLMLGIGANAVVFSVIDAVLLEPLPYRDPSRLVFMSGHVMRFAPFDFIDGAELHDWRHETRSFESMAGYFAVRDSCTVREQAFDVGVAYVNGDVLGLLGASPALGRGFLTEEAQPAPGLAPRQVALISDDVFRERFGGDPASLGNMVLSIRKIP